MNILFEDPDILVVDKPAGRIVHPAPGHETNSLTEELVRRCPSMAGVGSAERPGVVHRLDQDTSGVMVFAKTQAAYLNLRRQFESHETIGKKYLAVVHGAPREKKGTLDGPVGRERLRAVTHWEVLARRGPVSLVEFAIETGPRFASTVQCVIARRCSRPTGPSSVPVFCLGAPCSTARYFFSTVSCDSNCRRKSR